MWQFLLGSLDVQMCWGRWTAEALVSLELQPLQVEHIALCCGALFVTPFASFACYSYPLCLQPFNHTQKELYNVSVTANTMFGFTLGRELADVGVSSTMMMQTDDCCCSDAYCRICFLLS